MNPLTIQEVCERLRAELKAWVGVMPQSTFSDTLRRIEWGIAKRSTIAEFFGRFGYIGDFNAWEKDARRVAA